MNHSLAGIGLLGGTFDPIHYGHLRTALDVQQALGLSSVRLIPLKTPPHRDAPEASGEQRAAMIKTAIHDVPCLEIDTRELERNGTSYTVETLDSLRIEHPATPLYLLIGSDAFLQFPDWNRPDDILGLAHLVVMQRPKEREPDHYGERVVDAPSMLASEPAGLILFQQVTQLDISATAIRRMVAEGISPRFLLPDGVLEIIIRDGLYKQHKTAYTLPSI